MKINRKDGIYMTDMFIFASIKKDEEKKVIDEDLTFSKEEDAIKDMITSMKSSDEKLWDKYNNGEEVDIYLYQLDKEHHPCLYKKVEIEKDGDSYKVDDEESYDLPEEFEAFSLDDKSDKEENSEKEEESKEDEKKEIEEACKLVDVFFDLYETGVITEEALNDELLILEEVVGRKSVAEAATKRKEEIKKRRQWLKLHSRQGDGGYLTDEEREFVNSKPWSRAWEAEDDAKHHYHNTVCKYNEQRAAAKERLKKAQKEKKEKEKTMKYRMEPVLESSMMSFITEMHNDNYICEEEYNKLSYITFAAKMISESYEENNRLMIDSIALLSESAENELNEIQSSVESLNLNNYLIESILLVNEYMTEKTLKAKDRNALDEKEFGIPSLRKYPIHDKAHVKAAVQRFNFVDKAHEKELANNLIKALKKFNMLNEIKVGKGNRFKTYLDAEFKTFSESFDLYPFPAVTKEFSVGAMLPMMGNTKGWGTELANTPITDVVAAGNADLEKYATLYDTTELINDSEVAMESVLPKRNMIFDEEVKKLVKGLKDYVSNPKNDFLEDILKKSINFKKNIYTIHLKEQNGSDSNTIINKIKSSGFKNVDDEGIKAVFEKDVNGLLLTLVYDTVSDKLRITYEHMNKGESVITEAFDPGLIMVAISGTIITATLGYLIYDRNITKKVIKKYTNDKYPLLDKLEKKSFRKGSIFNNNTPKEITSKWELLLSNNDRIDVYYKDNKPFITTIIEITRGYDATLTTFKYCFNDKSMPDDVKRKYLTELSIMYNTNINGSSEWVHNEYKKMKNKKMKNKKIINESGKDVDDDIQSVVNILNKKGYKTIASCSGHTKSRIKEDVYRDGVYNNKLYTTARIVFADDFKLDPPKGWKVKNFDGKIGIYPVTPSYSYSKGMPDDAFDKWKSEYMAELKMWANGLSEKPGPEETKTESMDDFMKSLFGEFFDK